MDPHHLKQLGEEFALGEVQTLNENTQGVLNRNFVLVTSTGTYFLKSVRAKQHSRISYIAAVEKFFKNQSIPAVCMKESRLGTLFLKLEDNLYTVYPFIPNTHIHTYSKNHMRAMGEMLGRIHHAGASQLPDLFASHRFAVQEQGEVIDELTKRRSYILSKENLDEIDEVFLAYIDLKLKRIRNCFTEPLLTCDTLVHGDYHDRNILFEGEKIVGICDWEKALVAPRAYEVARALEIICFGAGQHTTLTEQDMRESASVFIASYRSIYPISAGELNSGLMLRLYKLIHSTWIERQHYDLKDERSNKFIPNEIRLIESDGLLGRIE